MMRGIGNNSLDHMKATVNAITGYHKQYDNKAATGTAFKQQDTVKHIIW